MMNNQHVIELSMQDGYDQVNMDGCAASALYFEAQQDVLLDYKPCNAQTGDKA